MKRGINMTYQLFQTALHWALESGDYEEFKHHAADSIYEEIGLGFKTEERVQEILKFIWNHSFNRNVDFLICESGLGKSEFARAYNIPLNTLQKWLYTDTKPPEYLLDLLAFAIIQDEE
jgi:DNA-binding transcriptional regulator YiaG